MDAIYSEFIENVDVYFEANPLFNLLKSRFSGVKGTSDPRLYKQPLFNLFSDEGN